MTETQITYTIRRPTTNPTARAAMRQAARLAERIAALTEQRDYWKKTNSHNCRTIRSLGNYVRDLEAAIGKLTHLNDILVVERDEALGLAWRNAEANLAMQREIADLQTIVSLSADRITELATRKQSPDPLGDLIRLGNLVHLP